ncbi:hypothetical protein M9458_050012, partial [Cirrhinus mrigala]
QYSAAHCLRIGLPVPHRGVHLEDPCGVCYRIWNHCHRSPCVLLWRLVAEQAKMDLADHL